MASVTAAHARDLGDYAALVRRRRGWILTLLLVGLVLSFVYLSLAARTYASTAKVLVKATGDSVTAEGARTNDGINLDTEAQLVTSEQVADRAGDILGSDLSAVALADRVAVTVPPNTTVMVVTFQAASPEEARDGAAAFAQAYLEGRQAGAQGEVEQEIGRLEERIEQVKTEIQSISVALSRLDGPRELSDRAFLLARRSTLDNQLTAYHTELAPLVGTEMDTGSMIMEARLPREPVDPDALLVVPAGLVLGLVAGLGVAVWRERADRRLHTAAEVERVFGSAPVPLGKGRSGVAHDVRALYHSLGAQAGAGCHVVLTVGPDLGPAVEELSCSLVVTAARSGATAAYVGRPGSPIIDRVKAGLPADVGSLLLLDYGRVGVSVEGQVRSARLPAALRTLTPGTDLVVLGLPDDDPSVGVPLLARHVDTAVVVVGLGVTRRESLAAVLADLSRTGVEQVVLGTLDLHRREDRSGLLRRAVRRVRHPFARDAAAEPRRGETHDVGPADPAAGPALERIDPVAEPRPRPVNGAVNRARQSAVDGPTNGTANGTANGKANGKAVAPATAQPGKADRAAGGAADPADDPDRADRVDDRADDPADDRADDRADQERTVAEVAAVPRQP